MMKILKDRIKDEKVEDKLKIIAKYWLFASYETIKTFIIQFMSIFKNLWEK